MTELLSDQEQIEMIKKWWRDYGRLIALVIVIGLLIGFGWRYWRHHQLEKTEHASTLYIQLQILASQNSWDKTKPLTDRLIKDYGKTPYATMASFLNVKRAVEQNHLPSALDQLQWVMKNATVPDLKQLARLRASRILLAENRLKAALNLLQTVDDQAYQPLVDEIKGDIYAAMGNRESAKQFYETAQKSMKAMGINDPYLTTKISE
ncbi:YfgM family protein [Coxiella endosymbiont of Ornithodoros maritimus]|uniref:YfgM family protein n=1 Tax=Coxiella endosymbiont of Ornithodoros maritimus TaxID=1656172 RepID=UPI002264DB5C|nr:tetratricopeptide repeat protein [Coxiella endosymbiont of Ornithodoros maritimus]